MGATCTPLSSPLFRHSRSSMHVLRALVPGQQTQRNPFSYPPAAHNTANARIPVPTSRMATSSLSPRAASRRFLTSELTPGRTSRTPSLEFDCFAGVIFLTIFVISKVGTGLLGAWREQHPYYGHLGDSVAVGIGVPSHEN